MIPTITTQLLRMDHQQQTQQTENLIKEMLEFLDSTSEEEDDPEKLTALETHIDDTAKAKNTKNGEELIKALTKSKKDKQFKTTITKELKKQYPIWNTKEIASKNKRAFNSHQTAAAIAEPIWNQSSLILLNKSDEPAEGDVLTTASTSKIDNYDWNSNLETNFRRSSSNAYIQEVQKAIYGDTTDHPASDSTDYYQAAQNYAVYGKNFLDFPENLQSVLNDKSTCSMDNSNSFANGLYSLPQGQGMLGVNSGGGFNNFVIPNTTTSNFFGTTSAAAPAMASTAAYYQICNGMQAQTRQTVGNAQAYGIILGNKVTYVAAAPTAPSIVYNQHTTSTANFISNSLANAALASSPALLYSTPVLTTTTQQCLNTFFKETQFLCSGGAAAANSAQGTAVGANNTGIYERLVYAQMLQQQMYYQTQQAVAAAAMYQHKQRLTAAVAAAAASASQAIDGVNSNIVSNENSSKTLATFIATTCNNATPKVCSRDTAKVCTNLNQFCDQVGNNSSPNDLLQTKQSTVTNSTVSPVNAKNDVSNVLKD